MVSNISLNRSVFSVLIYKNLDNYFLTDIFVFQLDENSALQ